MKLNTTVTKVNVNVSPKEQCFRLAFNKDTKQVLMLDQSTGETMTAAELECYTSEQECIDRIKALGLDDSAVKAAKAQKDGK